MSEWKTIDSAPEDGRRVLCWHESYSAPVTAHFYGSYWAIDYALGALKFQPSHWMPVPEPPND